jgi:hypothetical protein
VRLICLRLEFARLPAPDRCAVAWGGSGGPLKGQNDLRPTPQNTHEQPRREEHLMNEPGNDQRKTTEVQRQVQGNGETAKERAREAARDAADRGKERLQESSNRAASGVDDFADAVGTAASRLSQLEHEGLADYANQLASYLSDMSSKLREKNVDELANEVRRIANRNPALFVLGSVAVGLGLSRFVKASRDKRNLDALGDDAEWRGHANGEFRTGYEQTGQTTVDRQTTPDPTGGSGL